MVRALAVVEGAREAALVSSALARLRSGRAPAAEVLNGGSVSGAASLARSLLLEPANRVALVLDAESVEGQDTAERRRFLSSTLDDVRSSGWEIFLLRGLVRRLSSDQPKASTTLEVIAEFLWPPKSVRAAHIRLEAQMIQSLASWLEGQGWKVEPQGERGVDAVARREGEVLRIDVKASAPVMGTNAKAGANDRHRLGEAMYRAMAWLGTGDGTVAIAISDTPTFRRALVNIEGPLRSLGVGLFLVASDGSVVEHISPGGDRPP